MKSTNIYALATQIKFYSKNSQLMPNILWFHCIYIFKRIPKHQDLLFYEFSTNWYWISKITEKHHKEVPRALFMCHWLFKEHPGFSFLSTRGPWAGSERGGGGWPAVSRRGGHRRRGETGVGAKGVQGAPLGAWNRGWGGRRWGGDGERRRLGLGYGGGVVPVGVWGRD